MDSQIRHTLVAGMTRSGKGQLMRSIARKYKRAGIPVLYYTSKEVEAHDVRKFVDRVITDAQEFFSYAQKVIMRMPCIVMIDEAADFQQDLPNALREMLNKWAAYGCRIFVIVQRAKMVPPNIRNSCESCIAFKQFPDDAKFLSECYGKEFLQIALPIVQPGMYLYSANAYSPVVAGRSFYYKENGEFVRVEA
ncbi:MAG: ATP-binding protein [Pontiellaceae bacterium]|nr:ATP-binding protein [Pontiellaceae bacterium]